MNKKNIAVVGVFIIAVILGLGVCLAGPQIADYFAKEDKVINKEEDKENNTDIMDTMAENRIQGNGIDNFDLKFLQLENTKVNKVYSPLSIKYALLMLEEGANGSSKNQLTSVIGDYKPKKYINSGNMSFANALFIKNNYKDSIKSSYLNNLSSKFNASVIYDSFISPDNLNKWVSDKTFNLVNNLFNDVKDEDFILVNTLALDMEWVNTIKPKEEYYFISYPHESYYRDVGSLSDEDYRKLKFEKVTKDVQAADFSATINKYDIVNTLGEANIRKTVGEEYRKWLIEEEDYTTVSDDEVNKYMDKYIEEINSSYKNVSNSTDFEFYVDDNVKVFAKNLKKYNGITLQYVGIMPIKEELDNYIKDIDAKKVSEIISELKSIELDNFKEGVITEIDGLMPLFNFDYQLDLIKDLKDLGIKDVFLENKADLSKLTNSPAFINSAEHKASLEFRVDGIKATAATILAPELGMSTLNDTDYFDYLYDVPVEYVDLTFDKPYLFLIRDLDSNEIWFTGTVYEPNEYVLYDSYAMH